MAKRIGLLAAVLTLLASSMALAGGNRDYGWQLTPTGSAARLRGLSAVSERVAWTSGSLGTVLRTLDRGATWESVGPPGTETLQFRDIEAFDRDTAVILSIGAGTDSRIYRTADGGRTWTLAFQNTDPQAFYDCMAWFDKHRGLALSDPVMLRERWSWWLDVVGRLKPSVAAHTARAEADARARRSQLLALLRPHTGFQQRRLPGCALRRLTSGR